MPLVITIALLALAAVAVSIVAGRPEPPYVALRGSAEANAGGSVTLLLSVANRTPDDVAGVLVVETVGADGPVALLSSPVTAAERSDVAFEGRIAGSCGLRLDVRLLWGGNQRTLALVAPCGGS